MIQLAVIDSNDDGDGDDNNFYICVLLETEFSLKDQVW